jgi:hypothetical protein
MNNDSQKTFEQKPITTLEQAVKIRFCEPTPFKVILRWVLTYYRSYDSDFVYDPEKHPFDSEKGIKDHYMKVLKTIGLGQGCRILFGSNQGQRFPVDQETAKKMAEMFRDPQNNAANIVGPAFTTIRADLVECYENGDAVGTIWDVADENAPIPRRFENQAEDIET